MKNKFFYLLTIILLVNVSTMGQNVPTHHFKMIPQVTAADTALIVDSIYANGNHDSLISIDYKLYRNGVLIDTFSKYGWGELRLRQMGQEFVTGCFDSGTFVFPEAIPFAGMVAHSFTISVINAEPKCNRNRVPIIRLNFREPGTYKLVAEIYSQKDYKADYIGTFACSKYKDGYSLTGSKRQLWAKDSVSYVVNPTYVVTDTVSVCNGVVYPWRGKDYVTSGLYREVRHNTDGSDSVYQLKLTVYPSGLIEKEIIACQGVPQYWRKKYYTAAGVYYDSVINIYGCKDYYKLDLKIRPKYLHSDTVWVCKGENYLWNGRLITSSGRFTQVYTPVYHCDSVHELWVKYYPTYLFRDTAVICSGNSYSWRGRTLVKAGVYTDSLKTLDGCDSLHRLTLIIDKGFVKNEQADICSIDGRYVWHGRNLTVSGQYTDSLKNRYGCDSVYHLDFRIRPAYLFTAYDTVASNKDYVWVSRNRNLGKLNAGEHVFWDSLKTAQGCDSVYKLCLLVHPAYAFHTEDSICEDGIYQWIGHSRISIGQRTAGTYMFSDSLKTMDGSDSVYTLILHVFPTYLKEEHVAVCANETYQWKGHSVNIGLKPAGTYVIWDSLHTATGCDSVHKLVLTVYPTYFRTENASVCANEIYQWNGHAVNIGLKPAGTYVIYDSLRTEQGCDSVYVLMLTVYPTYFYAENASVCENETYRWQGHEVQIGRKPAGTYVFWDSLKTETSCDSVYRLNLTVHPVYLFNESATVCANEVYVWQGHQVNIGKKTAGNYLIWDSLKTVNGCDSVYCLSLKVHPAYYVEQRVTICSSDIYTWYGHEVGIGKREVGTYVFWDSLRSVNGCDSVFKLTLTVHPAYNFSESVDVCANEIYEWKGHDVNIGRKTPGTYTFWDRRKTKQGCDSVYKLTLRVHPSYYFESTDSTCDAASYTWQGHSVDLRSLSVGIHEIWDSLKSMNGCDSVYKHTLTVLPRYLSEESREICEGQAWSWRGRSLLTEGVYDDTLKAVNGCDSIFRMHFIVHPNYLIQEVVPICNNSIYEWRGRKLTQAGVYSDSLKTRFGCDSVYRLELRVNPVYLFEDTIEGCEGNSYTWRGRKLTQAGVYSDSLKASFGCDSIFIMTLRKHPVYEHTDTVEICGNLSYTWHGEVYCTSGLYTDSLQSVWGCDSICKLCLVVYPVYVMRDSLEICQNERVVWRNKRYTQPGLYGDSLHTRYGCDSVYTLFLNVRPLFEHTDTVFICSHETYQWRGRILHTAGHYEDVLVSHYGCDSIYNLQLMINPSYFYHDTQEICSSNTYYWRGRMLSKAGVYVDSLTSADGCPQVYTLLLQVHTTYHQADTAVICDNETYVWQGMELHQAGNYEVNLKTKFGCDSSYTLNLQVKPSYSQTQQASICARQMYEWHGRKLNAQGVYYDSLQSLDGCDSVCALELTVYPVYVRYDTVHVCQKTPYEWNGNLLVKSGDYRDSLLTARGCDSVFFLHLLVDSVYDYADVQYICEGSVFPWRGRYLTESGIYYDSLQTIHGCDSIYKMELHLYPKYYQEDTVSICENESYEWRGQILNAEGRYYDRMQSMHGCDSMYVLNLKVHSLHLTNEYAAICAGESYAWHGKQLREQKRYIDTLQSVYGCDSVTRIFLYVYPHYHFNDTVNYCGKGTYTWRNRAFQEDGCYTDSFKTVNGCDSIYTLYLRFRSSFYQEEQKEICASECYVWHGKQYAASGVYYDSLHTVYGCDSVYRLSLKVNPVYVFNDTQAICEGGVCVWRGSKYTRAGVYYDSLHTVYGCDSVYRLSLKVNPVYVFNDTQAICEGGAYVWRGSKYTHAGVYYDSLRTVYGCDSVYRLSLKVNPVYVFNDTQVICEGGVCVWRGSKYTRAGVYYDSLRTVYGCDSVYRLSLKENPVYVFNDTQAICEGGVYTWRGSEYTQAGVYADSLRTVYGCDSVYRLTLNVHPVYVFNDTQAICEGGVYTWRGSEYTQAGVYADSLRTVYGCDSVYQLQLLVHPVYTYEDTVAICPGDTLRWQGRMLTQAGRYTDTLRTVYGCDSIRALSLIIRDLPEKLGGIYGDTLIARDGVYMYYTDTLNGIDSYEWKVLPEGIDLTASEWKAWLTFNKSAYGIDTLMVVGHHICGTTEASVLPIHVTIGVRVMEAETSDLCRAFPNPVRDEVLIEVPSVNAWNHPRWMLCDAQGRCLSTGSLEDVQTRVRMEDYARGVYMIRLFSGNQVKATLKIVKY